MRLSELASYVDDKICSDNISLNQYVTTDSMLQNKRGRDVAVNLPPVACNLTHYKNGDVLVANIRPYLKKIWYADCDGGCSNDVLAFRVKSGHSSAFLYATLLDDRFFDYAMVGAKGSKMPRGDRDQIMRYEIKSCSICDEKSIGNFIVNNADKIQLNTQINHNLEALAKQLYDYWFVQFDFPDENGKPYKSSGGDMVYNSILKRSIPKGWEVKSLEELGSFRNGINYSKEEIGNKDYKIVNVRNISSSTLYLNTNELDDICLNNQLADKYLVKPCDILISRSGSPGETRIIQPSHIDIIFCGFIICFSVNEIYRKICLTYQIKQLESITKSQGGGSILSNISQDILKAHNVVYPPIDVISKFNKMITPIWDKINNTIFEKDKLTQQRNELLPLLMNGQATIKQQ